VVTEYCRGGSIIDFIKERKHFDENIVKIILKQLLGCLNYLHTLRIVHRDIKLENVVFINKIKQESAADDSEIKLLDFGTSCKMNKHKVRCSELIGTMSYMAPEIIEGYFTDKCDLWSCGVILFILLTSKSPFKCKKKEDTIQKILNYQPDFEGTALLI
jgi:serine/threonine protein kinase